MSERERWEVLWKAARAAHEAMQTWFSSEYLEHRICRELGAALAALEEPTRVDGACHTNNPAMPGCGHPLSAHTRDVPTIPRWGISTLGCSLCSCDAFVSTPLTAPDREMLVGRVESAVYRQDPGWSTGQTAARHALLSAWDAEVAAQTTTVRPYRDGWNEALVAAAAIVGDQERIAIMRLLPRGEGIAAACFLENDAKRILALKEPIATDAPPMPPPYAAAAGG